MRFLDLLGAAVGRDGDEVHVAFEDGASLEVSNAART